MSGSEDEREDFGPNVTDDHSLLRGKLARTGRSISDFSLPSCWLAKLANVS